VTTIPTTFEYIDAAIAEMFKDLGDEFSNDFKQFFDEFFFSLYKSKLELNIIIDANIILSDAYAYTRFGKSYLLNLLKSPFLKVFSPQWLDTELNKKIPEFSKDKGLKIEEFRAVVEKLSASVIRIPETKPHVSNILLRNIIERDSKDLPYIALYIEKKFHGILTNDKDIRDMPNVRTWNRPGDLGKIVRIFENGAFAYAVIGQLPIVATVMGEICLLILKEALEIIKFILTMLIEAGTNALSTLLNSPDWLKVAAFVGFIILLFSDKSRELIAEKLNSFEIWMIEFLKWLYEGLKSVLSALSQVSVIASDVITTLFLEVERTIKYYEELSSKG